MKKRVVMGLALLVGLTSTPKVLAQCQQPRREQMNCDTGNCSQTVYVNTCNGPFSDLSGCEYLGHFRFCCGFEIPSASNTPCGHQTATLNKNDLRRLLRTLGAKRLYIPGCQGGYQSLLLSRSSRVLGTLYGS